MRSQTLYSVPSPGSVKEQEDLTLITGNGRDLCCCRRKLSCAIEEDIDGDAAPRPVDDDDEVPANVDCSAAVAAVDEA